MSSRSLPHASKQLQPADTAQKISEPAPVANDGIDRRNFLSCMAWAGTGLLWTLAGGVPTSKLFAATGAASQSAGHTSGFSFVQISDSHIGFNKPANQDVTGTLKLALAKINALATPPIFCCIPATLPIPPSQRSSTSLSNSSRA